MRYNEKGFTLIELLIALVIVSILAAIAYPMYTAQVVKNNRSATEGQMMSLAAALENYKSSNLSYGGAQLSNLSSRLANSDNYTVVFVVGGSNVTTMPTGTQSYQILAKPKSGTMMAGTGALKLDYEGQNCWKKTSDSDCTIGTDPSWSDH